MKKLLAVAVCSLMVVSPVSAASLSEVVRMYVGANGLFYGADNSVPPSEFEAGIHVAASLSPHISVVGGLDYGFQDAYFRSTIGPRITATDVEDRNFSVGFGLQYARGGEAPMDEWCPEASVGWRPFPSTPDKPSGLDPLVVVGQGSYGLDSNVARAIIGLRWRLPAL